MYRCQWVVKVDNDAVSQGLASLNKAQTWIVMRMHKCKRAWSCRVGRASVSASGNQPHLSSASVHSSQVWDENAISRVRQRCQLYIKTKISLFISIIMSSNSSCVNANPKVSPTLRTKRSLVTSWCSHQPRLHDQMPFISWGKKQTDTVGRFRSKGGEISSKSSSFLFHSDFQDYQTPPDTLLVEYCPHYPLFPCALQC